MNHDQVGAVRNQGGKVSVSSECCGTISSRNEFLSPLKVYVRLRLNQFPVSDCLVDTGASVSLLPKSFVQAGSLRFSDYSTCSRAELFTAAGASIPVLNHVTSELTLVDEKGSPKWTGKHTFCVADIITGPILGADFLERNGFDIYFSTGELKFSTGSVPLKKQQVTRQRCTVVLAHDIEFGESSKEIIALGKLTCQGESQPTSSPCAMFSPKEQLTDDIGILMAHAVVDGSNGVIPVRMLALAPNVRLRKGKVLGYLDDEVDTVAFCQTWARQEKGTQLCFDSELSSCSLCGSDRLKLEKLLQRYSHVFSAGEHDLGRTSLVQHDIPTRDHKPLHKANYRQAFHLRKEANRQVETLLENGVIEPSTSPWSSPVLMVPKKDGSYRFCVDFRGLNQVSQSTDYPLPRVDECLEAMSGATVFTTLDLASGYWQVEVNPNDRPKTAFSTNSGHYQFVTMPMGLKGAPATFQRLMDLVMKGLKWDILLVYLDDILVFGRTADEHLTRLETVLERLSQAGLKLKPSKCHFGQSSVHFLGHIVSEQGIATDPSKTERVKTWPEPTNVSDLRAFLGLTGYYRRFIRDYAEKAAPLTDLTSKRKRFNWTSVHTEAFQRLKSELCSPPVLRYPIFHSQVPFILKTDASDIAAGAVLCQRQEEEGEHVVAYASRKFNAAERNYPAFERELLAVVWSMKHFRPYLYGQHFVVVTDNEPVTYLKRLKDPKGRLARWLQEICSFDFEIQHKSGKRHRDADALSRNPIHTTNGKLFATTFLLTEACHESLAEEQALDDDLAVVLEQLRSGEAPRSVGRWRQGKLSSFKRIWAQLKMDNNLLVRDTGEKVLIVLPQSQQKDVLRLLHDNVSAGHMGVEKTTNRVRERYYWPGYTKDVKEYVDSCSICQERTSAAPSAQAKLRPILADRPFQLIAMDFMELPQSVSGNKHCLVVSDYYTKWPEVFAVPDQKATTVAHVLTQFVFPRHGIPDSLHSDQGRSFENEVIQELCSILKIKKVRTTPYHPQSDGLVERLNRTILEMLSKYVSDHPDDWDEWLNPLVGAYRTAVHASTGFSPFELLYGRKARMPVDLLLPIPSTHPNHDASSPYDSHYDDLQQVMRESRERVEEEAAAAKDRQVKYYGEQARYQYSVGDKVMLFSPALRRGKGYKLKRQWCGPFEVLAQTGSVNYRIKRAGARRSKVVHYNRLKPWRKRDESETSGSESVHDLESSVEECSSTDLSTSAFSSDTEEESYPSADMTQFPVLRHRPSRTRRRPARFQDYVMTDDDVDEDIPY